MLNTVPSIYSRPRCRPYASDPQACSEALDRISKGKEHVLNTYFEQQDESERNEQISKGGPDWSRPSGYPDYDQATAQWLACRPRRRDFENPGLLSDDRVMALHNRDDDPTAMIQQLDYTPAMSFARGPPKIAAQQPTSGSTTTSSSEDYKSDSECSTPRAGTPVAEPAPKGAAPAAEPVSSADGDSDYDAFVLVGYW